MRTRSVTNARWISDPHPRVFASLLAPKFFVTASPNTWKMEGGECREMESTYSQHRAAPRLREWRYIPAGAQSPLG
jgi:hypothetical protein